MRRAAKFRCVFWVFINIELVSPVTQTWWGQASWRHGATRVPGTLKDDDACAWEERRAVTHVESKLRRRRSRPWEPCNHKALWSGERRKMVHFVLAFQAARSASANIHQVKFYFPRTAFFLGGNVETLCVNEGINIETSCEKSMRRKTRCVAPKIFSSVSRNPDFGYRHKL